MELSPQAAPFIPLHGLHRSVFRLCRPQPETKVHTGKLASEVETLSWLPALLPSSSFSHVPDQRARRSLLAHLQASSDTGLPGSPCLGCRRGSCCVCLTSWYCQPLAAFRRFPPSTGDLLRPASPGSLRNGSRPWQHRPGSRSPACFRPPPGVYLAAFRRSSRRLLQRFGCLSWASFLGPCVVFRCPFPTLPDPGVGMDSPCDPCALACPVAPSDRTCLQAPGGCPWPARRRCKGRRGSSLIPPGSPAFFF